MRSLTRASLLLFSLLGCRAADLKGPEVLDCKDGEVIDLEVRAGRVTIPGVVSFTTRSYYVNGDSNPSVPSKLIKMHAGKTCTIKVINNLQGEVCDVEHSNYYHCPDTTNLHTHGLHVSPYQDNIHTSVEPNGGVHYYTYELPKDHLMGTHWYHAHHHGSTAMQAEGGMAGLLYVEPHETYNLPSDLRALYYDIEYPEIPPMLMHHLAFNGTFPAPEREDDIFAWWDQQKLLDVFPEGNNVPLDIEWDDFSVSGKNFYAINGQYNPTITVYGGVASLMRTLHAGGRFHIALTLDEDDLCELRLLSRDGVFHQTPYLKLSVMSYVQGTRADIAILCKEEAVGKTINVRSSRLKGRQVNEANGYRQDHFFQIKVVARPAGKQPRSMPTTEAPFPHHFSAVMRHELPIVHGGETGVKDYIYGNKTDKHVINDKLFAGWHNHNPKERYLEQFCLNKVYKIKIGSHPDDVTEPVPEGPPTPIPRMTDVLTTILYHTHHQHINHFYINISRDETGEVIRDGEWRDTIPDVGVTTHFYPVRYSGEAITHCHMLQHEDRGMMSLLKFSDCGHPARCAPLVSEDSNFDVSNCQAVDHGKTCTVRNRQTGATSSFVCPYYNQNPDTVPVGVWPNSKKCENTCYGTTCDYYSNTYGYKCSVLESFYNCDCSGCECKLD